MRLLNVSCPQAALLPSSWSVGARLFNQTGVCCRRVAAQPEGTSWRGAMSAHQQGTACQRRGPEEDRRVGLQGQRFVLNY